MPRNIVRPRNTHYVNLPLLFSPTLSNVFLIRIKTLLFALVNNRESMLEKNNVEKFYLRVNLLLKMCFNLLDLIVFSSSLNDPKIVTLWMMFLNL